jgi:hypothetical protein
MVLLTLWYLGTSRKKFAKDAKMRLGNANADYYRAIADRVVGHPAYKIEIPRASKSSA